MSMAEEGFMSPLLSQDSIRMLSISIDSMGMELM